MTGRRGTPQSRGPPSGSKFRLTPSTLNSTQVGSASKRTGSARPQRAQSFFNATASDVLSAGPHIRANLTSISEPSVDYDLECDFAYCDYLQALMKAELLEKQSLKMKQELNDQLVIQKDNLFKNKMALRKAKRELEELEMVQEVGEVLKCLEMTCEAFEPLCLDFELEGTLKKIIAVLELACNKIAVKNVEVFEGQEGYDKLVPILEKCCEVCKKFKMSQINMEAVNNLGEIISKYKENVASVAQKQACLNSLQEDETSKLLKSLSDMYADKEKYDVDL